MQSNLRLIANLLKSFLLWLLIANLTFITSKRNNLYAGTQLYLRLNASNAIN